MRAHKDATLGLCCSSGALKLLQNERVLSGDIRGQNEITPLQQGILSAVHGNY